MRKMIVKRVSILFVNRIDERLAARSSISPRVAFSTSLINAVSMATASPVKWPKFLIDHINIIHIKHCYHVEIEKYREEKSFRRWANWCTTPPYLQERCWCLNWWCWKLWLRKRRKVQKAVRNYPTNLVNYHNLVSVWTYRFLVDRLTGRKQ